MLYIAYKTGWDASLISMDAAWHALHERLFDQQHSLSQRMQCLLNLSLNLFENDQSLRGLCTLSDGAHQSLNPFLAARDFSVRCLSLSDHQFLLNVSPISQFVPPKEVTPCNGCEEGISEYNTCRIIPGAGQSLFDPPQIASAPTSLAAKEPNLLTMPRSGCTIF